VPRIIYRCGTQVNRLVTDDSGQRIDSKGQKVEKRESVTPSNVQPPAQTMGKDTNKENEQRARRRRKGSDETSQAH
jgi:hypothetical protein